MKVHSKENLSENASTWGISQATHIETDCCSRRLVSILLAKDTQGTLATPLRPLCCAVLRASEVTSFMSSGAFSCWNELETWQMVARSLLLCVPSLRRLRCIKDEASLSSVASRTSQTELS